MIGESREGSMEQDGSSEGIEKNIEASNMFLLLVRLARDIIGPRSKFVYRNIENKVFN